MACLVQIVQLVLEAGSEFVIQEGCASHHLVHDFEIVNLASKSIQEDQ